VSALLFSTAHHIGPVGEPFHGYVFVFRTLAGVFFAVVYQYRGFGIAVGAHAFYDILVGVILTAS
jgi:membrane protease YdiL (CAAX protease family)